ncbi:MAG TPA: hypothetical protein PLF39_04865 [Synergistales bacterium]|nr:hypothetical protein [Synergistaceae bacterium]HPA59165.1 hypothetical protein [Synergistales bacterium]
MFILLTGDSAAGTAEPGRFPPKAEADFIWWGITTPGMRSSLCRGPLTHPVLIPRAARFLADFPTLVVRCGSIDAPLCPYMETGAQPGGDPAAGPALHGAQLLWDSGFSLGRLLAGLCERLVIGESCPGNGVTSRLILRALGYRADALEDLPSGDEGSSPWERASSRLGIRPGDLIGRGFEAAIELGDPVLVTAAAITAGAMGGPDILLAGGLPMLAVSAILRDLGEKGRISISTTTRTEEDLGGAFGAISKLLDLQVQLADIGDVPDGAGASGAVLLSGKYDITPERVLQRAEYLCHEISDQGSRSGEGEQ